MPELYLLDEGTFAAIARGESEVARNRLVEIVEEMHAVPALAASTEAAVRYGMVRGGVQARGRAALERLLDHFRILPFDSPSAVAQVRAQLQADAKSVQLTAMELTLAAQAIASGAVLVTHNPLFTQVDEIDAIEDWTEDLPR